MRFVVMTNKNLRNRAHIMATNPLRICSRVFFAPCFGAGLLKNEPKSCHNYLARHWSNRQ